MTSKIENIGSCAAKAELVPQNLKGSDPDSLAGQYAAWTQEAGASTYILTVPYKDDCIKMAVAAKGSFQTASEVTVAVPGFLVDNRGYEPSLKFFDPAREQGAFVAISLIGPGTYFPDSINPTPEALSEIYAAAARAVAPRVDPDGGLNIIGNSMSSMVAIGTALELSTDQISPIKADVGLDNSMTWDFRQETRTYLYDTLAFIQPTGKGMLKIGLATTLSIGWTRNDIVDMLYGIDVNPAHPKAHTHSRPEDRDYYRELVKQERLIPFAAKLVASMDQWDEYFLESFPNEVLANPDAKRRNRISSITLPGQCTIMDSRGDRLFRGETSLKLQNIVHPAGSESSCTYLTPGNPDSHVERTPRALRIHQELKKDDVMSHGGF